MTQFGWKDRLARGMEVAAEKAAAWLRRDDPWYAERARQARYGLAAVSYAAPGTVVLLAGVPITLLDNTAYRTSVGNQELIAIMGAGRGAVEGKPEKPRDGTGF